MREITPDDAPRMHEIAGHKILSQVAEDAGRTVYRARDAQDRLVALKVFSPAVFGRSEIASDVRRAATALSDLDHPNIAAIYGCGATDEGRLFVATEFVQGPTVERLILDRIELSLPQVLDLLVQACRGLSAAQGKGVTHLDVHPGNLIVDSKSRQLKVVDFGLSGVSRLASQISDEEATPPRFLPPPELRAGDAASCDHRTDIYGIGTAFFHLLAGRPPFDASKEGAGGDLPLDLRQASPEIPTEIANAIMRMLAADPNGRPQDYASIIAFFETVHASEVENTRQRWDEEEQDDPALPQTKPAAEGIPTEVERPSPYVEGQASTAPAPELHEPAPSGNLRPFIVTFLVFLLLIVVVTVVGSFGKGEDQGGGGGLAQSIARLLAPSSAKKQADPLTLANRENHARMSRVVEAIKLFQAENGRTPSTTSDLVNNGALAPEDAHDPWDNRYIVFAKRQEVVSVGLDGEEGSGDDWAVSFQNRLLLNPIDYYPEEDVDEYERKSRL